LAPHHRFVSLDVLHLQSVRTARLRYAQEPKSHIASASQVSTSHHSTTLRRSTWRAFGHRLLRNPLASNGYAYPAGPGGDHVQMRRGPLRLRRPVTGQSGRCTELLISLRIVLDGYLRHLGHSPAAATRFAPCGLHKAALPSVSGSHCAKASFGAGHRWRALSGEGNRPYAKWPTLESVTQPSALPVRFAPYAPLAMRPCGSCGAVALVRRCAQRSSQWPAASYHLCAPLPAPGPRRCAALAPRAGWPIRSPQG
jgi:hypothetical protein